MGHEYIIPFNGHDSPDEQAHGREPSPPREEVHAIRTPSPNKKKRGHAAFQESGDENIKRPLGKKQKKARHSFSAPEKLISDFHTWADEVKHVLSY